MLLPGMLEERMAPRTSRRSTRGVCEEHGGVGDFAGSCAKRSAAVCRSLNSTPSSRMVRMAGAGRPVLVERPAEHRKVLLWWWLASWWRWLGARPVGGAGVIFRGASPGVVGSGTAPVWRQGGVV